jgi:peptide/nickel transport system substrate-binding protein
LGLKASGKALQPWTAFFLLLALLACGGGERAGTTTGGTIVVGMRADLGGLNSITYSDQYTYELINYALFTPIVQYDQNLEVRPYLAESWELTGDTGVVFKLRRDVRWQDGKPVTAEDVKFTFDRAKDPAAASLVGSAFLANVDRAEVTDSFTVRFHYVRPHAQALEDFWWAPMPKHLLENVGAAELRNAPFNRQPVGSGPFKMVEWQANQRMVLEPNPAFPEALGGPGLARIVLRVIPEASTMLTELKTGGVHVDIPVTPDQVQQVKQDGNLQFHSFPGRTVYYIGWNHKRPLFTSPNVRRALALGINRQEIIDALLSGEGAIATSTVPPWHPLYPKDVRPLAYNQQEAGALLDREGWRDANGDGIREKGGQPLKFTLLSSDQTLNRSVVEMVQAQLRKIGVQVEARALEFQTLRSQHVARDFDAVFTSWVLDNFQMASAPYSLFHSTEAAKEGSTNRSSVRIPALDRLIDQAAAATNEDQARGVWRQLTEVLQREQPVTFMYWLNELAASQKTVQGVTMDPRGEFVQVAEWTIGRR